jgi:hypothetical protein
MGGNICGQTVNGERAPAGGGTLSCPFIGALDDSQGSLHLYRFVQAMACSP